MRLPAVFRVKLDPTLCPTCGAEWAVNAQGRWGDWHFFEAMCRDHHYWACDLIGNDRVLGLGYRMDRLTGYRREGVQVDATEKWNYPPDHTSTPPDPEPTGKQTRARGGSDGRTWRAWWRDVRYSGQWVADNDYKWDLRF